MSRPTKLMNNRIKERQHYRYDMNFDSSELSSTLYLRRRDVEPGQLFEEAKSLASRSVWDQPLKLKTIHRLPSNIKTDKQEAQEKTLDNTINPGSFRDRFKQIRAQRAISLQNTIQVNASDNSTALFNESSHFDTLRQLQDAYDTRSRTLKQFQGPSTDREIAHKKEIYVDALLPTSKTSYGVFYQNPRLQSARQSIADATNNPILKMQPDFYKSCLPKYLNLDYKNLVHGYETRNFKYMPPVCVRPREYDPSPDGVHRKRHLLTNSNWARQMRSQRTYN